MPSLQPLLAFLCLIVTLLMNFGVHGFGEKNIIRNDPVFSLSKPSSRVRHILGSRISPLKLTKTDDVHQNTLLCGIGSRNAKNEEQIIHRRSFLSNMLISGAALTSSQLLLTQKANAIPFLHGGSDRRQLELCLLTVLRTQYWAKCVAKSLKAKLLTSLEEQEELVYGLSDTQKKQPYLEARLGAKALLSKKIGGGANAKVVKLASFQIKDCLKDGKYWCGVLAKSGTLNSSNNQKAVCNQKLEVYGDELIESLASLVEFDGLDNTIDPSPRSSLMLTMYTNDKGVFAYKTLTQRVIPSCENYLEVFGPERRKVCEDFMRRDYAEEMIM
mmetsp:Transcript_5882/g.10613  ORF Transcript_5882/g.10613 Transcript_5882/m.10613 type:complete len:329 (+) Transcript_5882:150-1136(+)